MISLEEIVKVQEFSKDLTVLYVEDNDEARVSTLDVLNEFFNKVEIAVDGQEGFEKFSESDFDLIISDINMPRLNGIDMVAKIREVNKDIPILIVSAYSESGYFMETIRLGVEGYLLKPIELEQFMMVLTKTLEKLKLRDVQKKYQKYLEDEFVTLNKNIKAKNKLIQDQINKDLLTGLKNRFALERELEKNKSNYNGILIIDINNFRKFNELYGFERGNDILLKASTLLSEYCEQNDFEVYKVSADEFVLYKSVQAYDLEFMHDGVKDILELLDNKTITFQELEDEVILNITIGLTLDNENVLNKASSALDIAKFNNKKFLFYNEDDNLEGELKNLFFWQKEINKSLETNNIVPFYQPIYDGDKNIVKYEVLMRMRQYEDGKEKMTSPFFFLDTSIKTKQYDQLSFSIVSQALKKARENEDKVFSINLGYRDIKNPEIKKLIVAYVQETLRQEKECNLIFEIVESEDIEDYEEVKNFFAEFTCNQIKVAIDDFGSGYSNFSNILDINPQYLKIDGSLVKDIDTNEKHFILLKAIVSFAKQLNIKTIAEFVHSETIFELLKGEGIDEFQGFYLSEPKVEI